MEKIKGMKKLYTCIGVSLCLSLAACSTDNDLEAPLQGELGDVADGTIAPNPYWSWVTEFPGFVNVDEPRVEADLVVKGATLAEDTCWRSTGLYVVPGDTTVVTVNGSAGNAYYRIGGFTDVLASSLTGVKRYRDMDIKGKLNAGENKLLSYFGGHLYIYFKDGGGDLSVHVKNAVQSPDFVLGETDPAAWKALLAKTSVPYGELRSENVILTLPVKDLKKIADPAAFLGFYNDYVAEDCDGLYGERIANTPLRVRTDLQLTASTIDAHFGGRYPIVVEQSIDSAYLALPSLLAAADFTVCQSFSMPYSLETITAALFRPAYYGLNYFRLCDRKNVVPVMNLSGTVNSFVNSTDVARRFNDLSINQRTALFVQLAQQFGWNIYTYISEEMKKDNGGMEEQNLRDAMAMYATEYANANLLPFFEDWGVVLSPYAQQYLKQYPTISVFWKTYTQKAGSFDTKTAAPMAKAGWPVYTDANRTGWTATSTVVIGGVEKENMHDEKNNKFGPFKYMFDGNSETLWHSLWKGEGGRYPHTLLINMAGVQEFNYLYFMQRSTSDATNKCRRFQVYVKEGDNWTSVDNGKVFTLGKSSEMERVYLSGTYRASELKLVLLSPHPAAGSKFSNEAGQTVPVSISEFGVGMMQ